MESLYPTPDVRERIEIWKAHSGADIDVFIANLCDWSFIARVFAEFQPDTIVHYAEQPSAPYAMLVADAARLTVGNNIGATQNVVLAMRAHSPDAHLNKLGTMGEH
jgi:UDP-sulfoquinovose synthase